MNLELPPIYKRNGKKCYLDPIRKKLIYITPEETVRQRVIYYVLNYLKAPAENIAVEQHLAHYGLDTKKRADIVIHKRDGENISHPVAVIECKSEDVYLDDKARKQMLEYCDLIEADYAMMVNGIRQECYKYDEAKQEYIPIEKLPEYKDMLKGKYEEMEIGELPPRIPFEKLQAYLEEDFATYEEDFYGYEISKLTPMVQAVPMFNLWEALLDTRVKMPSRDYGLFKLIEDYGVRLITYGNAGGGKFYGPYRSFLVEVGGNTEFYSISFTTYCRSETPDNVKTCICIAHDDEKDAHHALQLVVEDNVVVNQDKVDFYHHGAITVGKYGRGKTADLRKFVTDRYPQIISDNKFFLGSITNNRLWRLDDPEVINVIVNMISYSIVREEYREFVKRNKESEGK